MKIMAHFPPRLYNNIVLVLFYAWLTNCSCQVESSEVNNHVHCVESERNALLRFKQGIHADYCGYLDSWGHSKECCQWHGIRCNNHSSHVISLKICGFEADNDNGYVPCLEGTLSVSLLNLKHLKYLDLSNNNLQGQLPKFIGSLASLERLNLFNAGFRGVIPQEIGNLSRLTSLDLSGFSNMRAESLWWLSHLRLIREVDLSYIDLSTAANTWLSIVNNLPFLRELRLDNCSLSLNSPTSLSYTNSSTTLGVLSLSDNFLNDTSIFEWLLNLGGLETTLTYLDLSENDMFGNNLQLSGRSMKRLDNLCSLRTLNLISTNLNYKLSNILQSFSKCSPKALESLKLSANQVWGSIPDNIGTFSFLRELEADENQLNGTLTHALGQLTMLERLNFASNSLYGTLTTAHLSNLSKLSYLKLSYNKNVVVNISANWIPPFQLDELHLSSCKTGPYFPRWITTQKYLSSLDICNASITGTIPISFWNSTLWSGISYLDMSLNMIKGTIPDVSVIFDNFPQIDLSYNLLEGVIPSFLRNNVLILHLNNNKFSKGLLPFLCPHTKTPLSDLDLSSNLFSEKLPDCWSNFDQLTNLHLENNSLWGSLPTSMGSLNQLAGLHLSNNNLSGRLPASLEKCKSLLIMDLGNNLLTGHIPPYFGYSFENLAILSLKSNNFVGVLPRSFCDISHLQFLDLSNNYISGTIPRCIYKLVSMANTKETSQLLANYLGLDYHDAARVVWKRNEQTFGGSYSYSLTSFGRSNSLLLLKGIDISNNKLEGHIPEGISRLLGLKFLNLSRNNLTGVIVSTMGQLTSLESLDLSHNHLSGEIPQSLTQISSLSILDISDNNLTGKIPVGTQLQSFDASSYMGNPGLCGAPLAKCVGDEAPASLPNTSPPNRDGGKDDTKDDLMIGLYISAAVGLITGFWGVCGTLVLKRSWRNAYFRFYEDTKDKVYVIWADKIAGSWRRS